MKKAKANSSDRRHVVIIGGGFGGLSTAKRLKRSPVRVTLIDRRNYHLFQPLLYQVATGGLSPANIATPLRYILRRQKNCQVLLAEVTGIDVDRQVVNLADGELEYDDLVVATGSTHSYFGNDNWETHAPGLKSIEDATEIRRRIFIAFEAAEREKDPFVRKALMTFVIVGGGPTGIELAGALSEIAKHTLKTDFRSIRPDDARVVIVEAGEHVLGQYPDKLRQRAEAKLRSMGIELQTQTKVTAINESNVVVDCPEGETQISARTVLWAAGVKAHSLGRTICEKCSVESDNSGRIPVTSQLTVGNYDNVYAIGDLARSLDDDRTPLPGVAPVAIQQGAYVAKSIVARMRDKPLEKPFEYRDPGTMATIGRSAAVAHIGNQQFSGFIAWIMWLVIHLLQIAPFQNRLLILMQWAWNYLTYNRSSRIITGNMPVIIVKPSDKSEGSTNSSK